MHAYDLRLGLPHTNHQGLAEHALLMHAGHFHWTAISQTVGTPLSALRDASGGAVYATFYFVEERFPDGALPNSFTLDDQVTFAISLRAFKNIAVEAAIIFDHTPRLRAYLTTEAPVQAATVIDRHPYLRFGNIFITPRAGNRGLKVAPPVNADFRAFAALPDDENPYHIVRRAAQTGSLELLDTSWQCINGAGFAAEYAVDPDRDSNGAGLVYFANYVPIMDAAERAAMRANAVRRFTEREIAHRVLQARRVAYYGNAALDDRLHTRVSVFLRPNEKRRVGFRYAVTRQEDDELICLSEAIKVLVEPER